MAQNELVMSKAATEDMTPAPQQVAVQGQAELQTETTGPVQSGNEESADLDAPMSMDYATTQSSSEAPAANGHLPTLPDVNLDPGQMGTDTVASATNDEASTNAAALAGMTNAHAEDMTNMTNDQSASDGHEAASSESDANATGQGFVISDAAALSQTNMSLGSSAAPIAAGMTLEPQPNSDNAVVNAEAAASQDQSVDTKDDEKATPPAPTTNTTEGQSTASEAPDETATASAIRTADSDIEEGEELSSPPRPAAREINTEQSSYSQSRRSPSPTASSRHQRSRDGRSRSPGRQRRPSPVRDGETKPSIDRSELFKVYIGGLPEKTEFADLQDCFSQFGEIGHIELKLGYAFIVSCSFSTMGGSLMTDESSHIFAGVRDTRRGGWSN